MKVAFTFLTDTVHIPLRSRNWPDVTRPVKRDGREFTVGLVMPVSAGTHDIPGGDKKVTDAQIPIIVVGEWVNSPEYFRHILEIALEFGGQLLELLRVELKEPRLRIRGLRDLEARNISSVVESTSDSEPGVMQDETQKFNDWFESISEGPRPFVSRATWLNFRAKSLSQDVQSSLHESLLMDAQLSAESDPRSGILYAALACEVFVQYYISKNHAGSAAVDTWLESVQNGSSPMALLQLYDLGLRMIGKQSLERKNPKLHEELKQLNWARNDIAHRGRVRDSKYSLEHAVNTARKVIDWVERFA